MPTGMNDDARPRQTNLGRQLHFLRSVWSRHEKGFVFLAARQWQQIFKERAFDVRDLSTVALFLRTFPATRFDVYFCPNAFRKERRKQAFAFPTPFAWCDIDEGNPAAFSPQPTKLIATSPGRHQGLWEFQDAVSVDRAEAVSRHLAYEFGGDRNGWTITKLLRVPFTFNHKPTYPDTPRVRLIRSASDPLSSWPKVAVRQRASVQIFGANPFAKNRAEVLEKFRPPKVRFHIHRLMRLQAVERGSDRSKLIFLMISALYRAGATRDEIAAVIWETPHFQDKHGPDLDILETEIARVISKCERDDEK